MVPLVRIAPVVQQRQAGGGGAKMLEFGKAALERPSGPPFSLEPKGLAELTTWASFLVVTYFEVAVPILKTLRLDG